MTTNADLTSYYRKLRHRCTELGRSLSAAQAATMSPCCPEWSVKDLFAHLVGVPVDVLEGNLEDVGTAPWADAHVQRRSEDSLAQILDEWEQAGPQMEALLEVAALDIDPRFFLDSWTHEWDIRQALGLAAEPDMSVLEYLLARSVQMLTDAKAEQGYEPVMLVVSTSDGQQRLRLGDPTGEPAGEIAMSSFEYFRVLVGRRSAAQITTLSPVANPDQLVVFSPAATDIVDPVLSR